MAADKRCPFVDQGGWTLVELILTLSLMGLLLSLALPAFVQLGNRMEREMFLDVFASDIRMARQEARLRETEVVFQWNADGTSYRIVQGGRLLRRERVPPPYRMESNYPGNRLVFRRSGQVRGGTVHLVEEGKRVGKVVIQVASGRPRVEVDW